MADALLKGRVRASKHDEASDLEFSESDADAGLGSEDESDPGSASGSSSANEEDSAADASDSASQTSASPPGADNPLGGISFGALASAQSSLGLDVNPRKRKRPSAAQPSEPNPAAQASRLTRRSPSPFHEAEERRAGKHASNPGSRSSKHAPTELSSKKAVSRKRQVVHVPKVEARDPRFSSLSGRTDEERVRRNYAFLDGYRKDELAELKQNARKEKSAERKEEIKMEVRRMEDRERARKREEEQREVLSKHRREEKEKVKEGKTPYFLKQSEVKKQVLKNRFEELGEKKAEKVMERRRKKRAQKERKSMPDERRVVG